MSLLTCASVRGGVVLHGDPLSSQLASEVDAAARYAHDERRRQLVLDVLVRSRDVLLATAWRRWKNVVASAAASDE